MEESNAGTAKLKREVEKLLQAWDVSDAADALEKHGWTSLKKMQLMEDADVDAMALLPATKKVLNTQLRTWKTEAAAARECADISAAGVSAGTANPSSAPTTTPIEEVGAEEVSTVVKEESAADAPLSGACDQRVKQARLAVQCDTRCRAFENSKGGQDDTLRQCLCVAGLGKSEPVLSKILAYFSQENVTDPDDLRLFFMLPTINTEQANRWHDCELGAFRIGQAQVPHAERQNSEGLR
jgi:hypothetical protein